MLDQVGDRPTAWRLFAIFTRIGLTSFGGGLSGWLMREFVHRRNWMTEEEFLNGLSLAQAIPGVNVTNMSIWIGYRLRGGLGAFAALTGIIVPSAIFIVVLAVALSALTQFELTHWALEGAAAAAIGLSLTMAITAARRVRRRVMPLAIMVVTFLAIGVFHLPLTWVVLIGAPLSILLVHLRSA